MTSRTSWTKFIGNEVRSKIWVYAVWALVLLVGMPVTLLMSIDSMRLNLYMTQEEFLSDVTYYLQYGYGLHGFVGALLGFMTAFFCFFYVYKRSSMDLYHSLPIKRERLFIIRYLVGVLPGLILQIVTCALSFAALAIRGCLVPETASALFLATIHSIVATLMAYHVALIAIMLTGTLVVGVLGGATLMCFTLFFTTMLQAYQSTCFQTYYYGSEGMENFFHMLINPCAIFSLNQLEDGYGIRLFVIFLEAMVFAAFALYLYMIRPSECVGKALCYRISKPIIRIPIVIFAALCGGLYVSFLMMSLPEPWFWTAFLALGLLAHIVIELIFEQEVKGIFRHPVQLIICLVIAGFIAVSYQYDLFGYDRYMPVAEKVESVGIRLSGIENEISHFTVSDAGEWEYGDYDEILHQDLLHDPGAALDLANKGIASLNPERSAIKRMLAQRYGEDDMYQKEKLEYVICYHMKDGKDVYRVYRSDMDAIYAQTAEIYESDGYKNFLYQAKELSDAGMIETLSARNWEDKMAFDNAMINTQDFIAAYAKDLAARKLDDLTKLPILRLSSYDSATYMDVLSGYYLYESDQNAVEYLRSVGINVDDFACRIDPDQIDQIKVFDYSNNSAPIGAMYKDEMVYTTGEVAETIPGDGSAGVYTRDADIEKIRELAEVMVPSNMGYNNNVLHPLQNWIDLEVTFTDDMDNTRIFYFTLPFGCTY